MRRFLFFLLLTGAAACSPGPRKGLHMEPNQLLRQGSDLYRTELSQPIKSVGAAFLRGRNIVVRYPDGRTEKVPRTSVWGYSNKKGDIYRLYGKTEYEVVTIGDVITYRQETTQNTVVSGQAVASPVTETFYSKTLDSKIFSSRKKALHDPATL